MKVKHFVLAGAIGMLTMVGMPQTEASPLSDVLDTQAVGITVSDSSQDMVALRGGHGPNPYDRHRGGQGPRPDEWRHGGGHGGHGGSDWYDRHDPHRDGWDRGHDPGRGHRNPPPPPHPPRY